LVNDIKKDDPRGPTYTLRCPRRDWYMILKGSAAAVPTLLVPPWGLVYDIKKDVPPGPPYPQVPPWGLV